MKDTGIYKRIKYVVTESKDLVLAIAAICTALFGAYAWYSNQAHKAELARIEQEKEIVEKQAGLFVEYALSDKFVGKIDSLIDTRISNQLDTIRYLQEQSFEHAANFYYLSAIRSDTIIVSQQLIKQNILRIESEIRQIKRNTDYTKESAYTDSLQNELARLKAEQETQRILRQLEYNHKKIINEIRNGKSSYDVEQGGVKFKKRKRIRNVK